MNKLVLPTLVFLSLCTASFALEIDYGQGKFVNLEEEISIDQSKSYKVVWKNLIQPKIWMNSNQLSFEFDEKACKQKKKYFEYKLQEGMAPKDLENQMGQSTSDLMLNFSISDFYLNSDFFRFALDKKGISTNQVLKNDLNLEIKEVEILFAPDSIGELIGAENAELYLKDKISKSAFALEEFGKIVLKSNNLALNCAFAHDQVEAINFVISVKQNPKISWVKKISELKIMGISARAQIESAIPSIGFQTVKKEGALSNMMNYMLSLYKNNDEEILADKDLSYKLFTHLTNADSSKFLKIDHDSSLSIALKLADKKETPVQTQVTKNVQLIKESL